MSYIWILLATPWLAPLLTLHRRMRAQAWRVYAVVSLGVVAASILAAVRSPALYPLGRLLLPLVAVVGSLAVMASRGPLHGLADPRRYRIYLLWLQAFWWSLLVVAVSSNVGLSWLSIELTTVTSGALVGISGERAAVEAAWKYVVLCSLGLLLALMGLLLVYSLATHGGPPSLAALDFPFLHRHALAMPPEVVRISLLFLVVGLGTKVGLAPMHTWLPDAHSEAPAPVSGLLSGVLLPLALVVLWRTLTALSPATGAPFGRDLLLGFGLLTVLVATPFLLVQMDVKRLLAYSSMEQMGLIAIGLGVASPLAVVGAVVQIVVHALIKAGLFFVAGDVLEGFGSKKLPRFLGLLSSQPRLGLLWLFGVLTLAGLPPLPMFPSEMAIVFALFAQAPPLGWALVAALGTIFVGMAHYSIEMAFGEGGWPRRRTGVGHSWRSALAAFMLAMPLGWALPSVLYAGLAMLAVGR